MYTSNLYPVFSTGSNWQCGTTEKNWIVLCTTILQNLQAQHLDIFLKKKHLDICKKYRCGLIAIDVLLLSGSVMYGSFYPGSKLTVMSFTQRPLFVASHSWRD
jgi:hypothetical protein